MVRAPVLTQPTVQALQGKLKDVTLIGGTDSKTCSKVIHNMFYSTMGVVQFTVWEAIFLHCYATNRLPYLSDEQVFNLLPIQKSIFLLRLARPSRALGTRQCSSSRPSGFPFTASSTSISPTGSSTSRSQSSTISISTSIVSTSRSQSSSISIPTLISSPQRACKSISRFRSSSISVPIQLYPHQGLNHHQFQFQLQWH